MTIYRSPAGRRALQSVYSAALAQLDITLESASIETAVGTTHVLSTPARDRPPVLLLHGGNATNPMTLSWYTGLARSHRLIAPDTIGQPGHSDETRVDPRGDAFGVWVGDILDHFGIESAPMLGTSYGAGIVLRAAAHTPDRIDGAALVVPAGFGTGPIRSLLRVGIPAMAYRYVPADRFRDAVLDALMTEPEADPVARRTIAASLRHVRLARRFPTADSAELADFRAPIAVFVAECDPFFSADSVLPTVERRLPNLALAEVLRGERHVLSIRARQHVTDAIGEFLARTTG